MKIKNLLVAITILSVSIIASCKKDSEKSADLTVRYEVATTQNIVTSHPTLGKLDTYIGYTKDNNGNEQLDEQITGKTWIKEIVISKPSQNMVIGIGANIYMGSSTGSATAKVFVNGKLEAEVNQQGTTMPVSNLSLVIVGAHYNYVKD